MELHEIIPATLARMQATAKEADAIFEENKNGFDEKEARNQVVQWYRSRVFEMTENLTVSEKVAVISRVIAAIK